MKGILPIYFWDIEKQKVAFGSLYSITAIENQLILDFVMPGPFRVFFEGNEG